MHQEWNRIHNIKGMAHVGGKRQAGILSHIPPFQGFSRGIIHPLLQRAGVWFGAHHATKYPLHKTTRTSATFLISAIFSYRRLIPALRHQASFSG
jgi:hypothetical protein